MNHKLLSITAICATMIACSSKTETVLPTSVELPGTIDNEAFAANVESISVMNLEMCDSWVFADWSYAAFQKIVFSDNYTYLLNTMGMSLMCFDRQTGEIVSSRTIMGNGPGEIVSAESLFCIGDTLCIADYPGVVRQYDHNCRFIGKMNQFGDWARHYNILRLNNGYAFVSVANIWADTLCPAVILTDKSFNIKSRHFSSAHIRYHLEGYADVYFANGDTVRFFHPFDNHIYSLCGDREQCMELNLPNPLTIKTAEDIGTESIDILHEYDGFYSDLCESGRFVCFGYNIDKVRHWAMVDKYTNSVVSIKKYDFSQNDNSISDIVTSFFKWGTIILTDGKFIYLKSSHFTVSRLLNGHDDILDARLQKTQAEYRAYLLNNIEYLKGLESEELNTAAILLKIKLKD